MPEPDTKLRSSRWGNVVVLLAAIAVSLAALEAGVRLLGIQPRQGPYDPNVPDAALGMKPLPNQKQKADFKEYAGTLILQTNNLGFYQSKETQLESKPGTTRMVVLGDSFVAGASNAHENIPSVLERNLNVAHPAEPVEVLNAGAGRYAPYHCYVRLRHEILRLKPKHVIVAEYVGNDFLDLIRQDDRPYLTANPDGTWQAHPPRFVSYRDPSIPPGLMDHSRIYSVVKALLGPTVSYQFSRVRIMRENLASFGYSTGAILSYLVEVARMDRIAHGMMLQILHQQEWFERFPETLDLALRVNHHVIELYRDLCREQGIELTYTVIPSADQIEPELLAETFEKLKAHDAKWTPGKVAAFSNRLTDETRRSCQTLGVRYVDLREGIRRKKTGERMYYPYDLHMNPRGNAAAGEVLAAGMLASQ